MDLKIMEDKYFSTELPKIYGKNFGTIGPKGIYNLHFVDDINFNNILNEIRIWFHYKESFQHICFWKFESLLYHKTYKKEINLKEYNLKEIYQEIYEHIKFWKSNK